MGGKLVWGKDCPPQKAYEAMMATKHLFHKTGGRPYAHFVHSFHDDDPVTPEMAYQIGHKFLMTTPQFKDFQVLMAVHTNEDHLHLHYVVNSVNQVNGKKWQCSKSDLANMRGISDELCREYGLSVIENPRNRSMHYGEFTAEQSWKQQLALDITDCLKFSRNLHDFAYELELREIGLKVYPPNYAGHTFVFEVPKGYGGIDQPMKCSHTKLMGYGDFDADNLLNIMEFNDMSGRIPQWDTGIVQNFMDSFDCGGSLRVHEDNGPEIFWNTLSKEEIEMQIARLRNRSKEIGLINKAEQQKQQSKHHLELVFTCTEELLEVYRNWVDGQLYQMEDDWDR